MINPLAVRLPEESTLSTWQELLKDDPNLSDATAHTYAQGLHKFREWLAKNKIESVGRRDVERWKAELSKGGCTPNTVNTWLSGIRHFYAWAEGEGLVTGNPSQGVKGVKRKDTKTRHLREKLSDEEIRKVLALPNRETPVGIRDYAILCLKAYVPIRDVEIHRADFADLSIRDDVMVLKVQPKGSREKSEVKVIAKAIPQDAMSAWLAVRGRKPGALFTSLSDRSLGKRLSLSFIRHMVIAYYRVAGITEAGKTSHSMRHSAITKIVKAAGPMKAKEAAGHASLDTTMIYYHEENRLDDPGEAYIDYGE